MARRVNVERAAPAGLRAREKTLFALAWAVWLGGAASLLLKGTSLLYSAHRLDEGTAAPILALVLAVIVGALKARFVMSRSAHKNIARIRALPAPRLWNFYSGPFFLALLVMIATGATLSRLADGHVDWLCVVGSIDLSIGLALLLSSFAYITALRR
jgi:hypothetical protein